MAIPTNTFQSTAAIGNREDLSDVIYRIAPTLTPLMNLASKGKATATTHEWQTQDLAAASGSNEQLEGDDASAKSITPTVRLTNRTQISTKTVIDLAVASSPSSCSLDALTPARSWVCHSCVVAVALLLAARFMSGVNVGVIR